MPAIATIERIREQVKAARLARIHLKRDLREVLPSDEAVNAALARITARKLELMCQEEPKIFALLTEGEAGTQWVVDDAMGHEEAVRYQEPIKTVAALASPVATREDVVRLLTRLQEYKSNPHHINPMSARFKLLLDDVEEFLRTLTNPKEAQS